LGLIPLALLLLELIFQTIIPNVECGHHHLAQNFAQLKWLGLANEHAISCSRFQQNSRAFL